MKIVIEEIQYNVMIVGEGEPLLCLHGFSESMSTWHDLDVNGYQRILVDLIGHGRTQKPTEEKYYKAKSLIKHLFFIMDQLGFDRFGILGYSMGGRIAMGMAVHAPERINFLVLESASYNLSGMIRRYVRRQRDLQLAKNIQKNGIEWFEAYWSDLGLFEYQKRMPPTIRNTIRIMRLSNDPMALSMSLKHLGQGKMPSYKDKLNQLGIPTLYVSGSLDGKYQSIGSEMAIRQENVQHVTITDVGHNTHLKAKDFNKVMNAFLQKRRKR